MIRGPLALCCFLLLLLLGCQTEEAPLSLAETVTATITPVPTASPRPTGTAVGRPPSLTPRPTGERTAVPTPTATPALILAARPDPTAPTLADFWAGRAEFALEVEDTGLPMGESDTIVLNNGELWSYLHASDRSAGVVDQCGQPVAFPGCTVILRSYDGGFSFTAEEPLTCQFACAQCPCEAEVDHITQQQYPRVFYNGRELVLLYEYLGRAMMRRSTDGLSWDLPQQIAQSTIWKLWLRDCPPAERIGEHPFVPYDYECLAGGPPGVYVTDGLIYVFMAVGQSPGGMGCYVGRLDDHGNDFQRCENNPLFSGAGTYGPLDERGPTANPYFDFRTISSADVHKIGSGAEARYYMLYEGIRGPGPGDPGDTQFGLGLARSLTEQIDGPWETFPGNPILVDLPGNIGLGHADLVIVDGQTVLYTSLDGEQRSRLRLVWK